MHAEIGELFENNLHKALQLFETNLFTLYSHSELITAIQLIIEDSKDTEQIMRIIYNKLQSVLKNYGHGMKSNILLKFPTVLLIC